MILNEQNSKFFSFTSIKSKMNATMQLLPSHIIKFTDPEELRIIMNEFFFNLKNNLGGYDKASYWVSWLIQWEKINKNGDFVESEKRLAVKTLLYRITGLIVTVGIVTIVTQSIEKGIS